MRLTEEEEKMLDGKFGEPRKWAMDLQLKVGDFFEASEMIKVVSAHIAIDAEIAGEEAVKFYEKLCETGGRFVIPTTTDPCAVDFTRLEFFRQERSMIERQIRLNHVFATMGAELTDSCINYQMQQYPRDHLAWGDTGAVTFANSVIGAFSNYEGGPAAFAADLTGRVPKFGFHLQENRLGTVLVEMEVELHDLGDWSALGCYIGQQINDYWQVPVFKGIRAGISQDCLKRLGASLASYGSIAMFHILGITPEASTLQQAFADKTPISTIKVAQHNISSVYDSFPASGDVDLVVFSAPQLSYAEMVEIAKLLEGKNVNSNVKLILTTNYHFKLQADKTGLTKAIERTGAIVSTGVCFYLMTGEARPHILDGMKNLVTDSAKLANIVQGYGLNPTLRTTKECIELAIRGHF